MTLYAATAETYVVEVNPQASEGYTRTPVLAWLIEEKRPLPVTLNGKCTLIGGDIAVMFPGGMVEHPNDGLAYDSVEAWLESNPGQPKKHPPAARNVKPVEEAPESGESTAYDIEWLSKPYKSNSFWHYDDGEHEFVFIVEGGGDIPEVGTKVAKIKRDEFMALKKTVDALTIDDIMNAEPLEVTDDEDDDDDADDDADDLI